MTHDKLLTLIEDKFNNHSGLHDAEIVNALYKVVELHKPSPIPDWVPTEDELMCWCAHVYPCPTVKAIEKELQ